MKIDPNLPHIEIDLGGRRFTHYPSGDTLLRHDYLRWQRQHLPDWKAMVVAFAARHPDTHLMTDSNRNIIDDIRTWPPLGGRFQVGDFVVNPGSADRSAVAREIIATAPSVTDTILDFEETYILDDGEQMYWSSDADAWTSKDHLGRSGCRLRPLLPDERPDDMLVPSADMITRLCSDFDGPMTRAINGWGLAKAVGDKSLDELVTDLLFLDGFRMAALDAHRSGRGTLTEVTDLIEATVVWVRDLGLEEKAKGTDLDRYDGLLPVTRRAAIVLETLHRRGVEVSAALAP
ncbi:hypothetical protein [Bosea sp. ANAM02]|uniref:hypothetical protein n=1 Tax=Bosea sp. ANAM02 TaxID=2020412 RepID=UPI00140EA85D|nr:hypothetical protein [Bosea sp. ANAM02]BCB22421.1 hypothetical protein OCUBac02_53150 [Bosea sp. ANAM02]